jgi:PAS domain S-box-containing protein
MALKEEEERSALWLAVDYEIVRILAECSSLAEATPRLLETIGRGLGWDLGAIWEVDSKTELLNCVDTWQAQGIDVEDFKALSMRIRFAPAVGLPGRVWASGEPAWIVDVTQDANFPRARAAAQAGLHAAFGFPIRSARGTIGVIEFFAGAAREPDPALLEVMALSGSQIGQFMERARAEEEVRRSETLKSAILDSALDCIITMDHEGRVVEFNAAAEATFGYERDAIVGEVMADLIIPPSFRERHKRALECYIATGEGHLLNRRLELKAMRSDGSEFPVEVTITRIGTEDPPMFAGYVRDITDRRRHDDALRFLADTSAALDTSLELDVTLEKVARLMVPFLADACAVVLLEEDGSIKPVATAASDPTVEESLNKLREFPIDPAGPDPTAKALRQGHLEIVPDVTESQIDDFARSAEHAELLRKFPLPARGVVTPLKVRGRTLGAISFGYLGSDRTFSHNELSLMEEVARRAAIAIDNARLYKEAQVQPPPTDPAFLSGGSPEGARGR